MGLDAPYFHVDRPAYAEIYRDDGKSIPARDDAERLHKKDKRENNPPPPPAINNFSPQVATLSQSANLDIRTALAGKIDFDNLPSTPKPVRQIPPAKPRRADQTQSRDHDALKKEAYVLALEIRRHKQRKLLIEAGLVDTNETGIEEIENRIEEYESRLREIAGASPIISAVVRKKALPLTEIAGEYAVIQKSLARKRALQEKFYQAQSDRQKRNLQKHIDRVDAELAAIFTIITQNQETAENEADRKHPHEREKRLGKIIWLMAKTRHDLRLVSRKWERIDASKEAAALRQTLRAVSSEREALFKIHRVRTAQSKKEIDNREAKRRQKACPEYRNDDGDNAEIIGFEVLEEEKSNGAYDKIDFGAHEDEYQRELADYESEADELAALFEQPMDDDDNGDLWWGSDEERAASKTA